MILIIVFLVLFAVTYFLDNKYQILYENQKIIDPFFDNTFSSSTPIPTSTPKPKLTEIILTGDIMLGRTVMKKTYEVGDYSYPFRKIYQELNGADLVFVNL